MIPGNAPLDELPLFSAVLRPSRSLPPGGLLIVLGLFGAASFVAGIVFALMGAWPVFGFFGLDVALLYWAFRVNNRDGRAYEVVTVTPSELTVRKVSGRGAAQQWTLNPRWVRLDREGIETFGTHRLFLVSHGRRLPVASVLGHHEKEGFAKALAAALSAARGP